MDIAQPVVEFQVVLTLEGEPGLTRDRLATLIAVPLEDEAHRLRDTLQPYLKTGVRARVTKATSMNVTATPEQHERIERQLRERLLGEYEQ
jgi:hypothetical protein